MSYGVTPQGYVLKSLEQCKADIIARLKAAPAVGPNQDYSDTSPLGQIIGALASEPAEIHELGKGIYDSGDPEAVTGVPQDQLYALTGSPRLEARPSRIEGVLLNLDPGALVPAGSQASVDTRPDLTFTLDADVSSPTGATGAADYEGDFTCTFTGPTAVNADTLTVIDTAVNGWNSVTNPADATPGRNVANAIEFRQRWSDERAQRGSTTPTAIRAALLNTVDHPEFATIEKVLVLTNRGDVRDANGLPPHSVEAIIDDGISPSVDDNLIAQVVWDAGVAAGIDTYGNQSGTATDSEGVSQTVYFSRVTRRNIYVHLSLTRGASFPVNGDAAVAQALVAQGNAYKIEDDVIALFIRSQAFNVAGVTDVPTFAIGFAPGPTEDDNLPIGYRERATFATDRITVDPA